MKISPKIQPDETERKPVCAYCDSTVVREAMPGFKYRGRTYEPDYICKECGAMTSWYGGACWDDLSEAGE